MNQLALRTYYERCSERLKVQLAIIRRMTALPEVRPQRVELFSFGGCVSWSTKESQLNRPPGWPVVLVFDHAIQVLESRSWS